MLNFIDDSTSMQFDDAQAAQADVVVSTQMVFVGENLIFITRDPE